MKGKYVYTFILALALYAAIGGILTYFNRNSTSLMIYIVTLILFLLALVMAHKKSSYYICPECDHMFEIGLFKDLISPNDRERGKNLVCPKCGKKGWFEEHQIKN